MILPPQQILQANGKTSIDMLKMSPNSSVLIADTTAPVVWRCISDGLGNVTAEPFDISPHKTEEQIERENLNTTLIEINDRLKKLEANYESVIARNEPSNKTVNANSTNGTKPSNGYSNNGSK